jgi:hypothetical protein
MKIFVYEPQSLQSKAKHPPVLKSLPVRCLWIAILFCASAGASVLHAQTNGPLSVKTEPKHYDVAAFVWPSYCPDDRAKIFWPEGIGEWQTVMHNEPKYEGQDQPRVPLWGYVNEADRYVMEMEIAAAADHGVNVFIYDWYWYDRMPFLEGCLDDGFLKAKNNQRMKFYLMWANHDVNLAWDKRNADDAFTQKNKALIWKGGLERAEFEKIAHRWIGKYFSKPTYYKIDGKPVLMIYDLENFVNGLGGEEAATAALAWFREEVKKAGFPGVELQLTLRGDTDARLVDRMGFDSLTHYQFVHFMDVGRDYSDIVKDLPRTWNDISAKFRAHYYPHVSIGWDSSPRTYHFRSPTPAHDTPENFEKALQAAKDYVDAHTNQAPLITLNSWNEWTETSYLEPDRKRGYGYLEAVRRVFMHDLALASNGATATSDSEIASDPGCTSKVIDGIAATPGDFSNRWHSALDRAHPHWVEVHLARPSKVGRVVIHFADPNGYPVDFEGAALNDGRSVQLFHVIHNDDPESYEAEIDPVIMDSFRLTIRSSANSAYPNAAQISEIELYP